MGCNCEGKTINIGMGCCQPVLAPIENYYTKWQVDKLIEDIEVSGVTEEELDEKISSATSGMATEQWVEDQGYLTQHQSLEGYVTENDLTAYTYDKEVIDEKASQSTVDTLSGDIQAVSAQVETIISGGGMTSGEVQTMIDQSISGKTNESDFSAHTANTTVHVTSAQTASWDAKPSIWSGTEAQWSQISGNTQQGVIYLVY